MIVDIKRSIPQKLKKGNTRIKKNNKERSISTEDEKQENEERWMLHKSEWEIKINKGKERKMKKTVEIIENS